MIARLLRKWLEDLCQFKAGAIASVILCGVVLGAVIAMCTYKPPAAGEPHVQSSSGQVQAACQQEPPAACAAPISEPELIAHGTVPVPGAEFMHQSTPNAYNVLVPDWGGTSYRLKTIVNQ